MFRIENWHVFIDEYGWDDRQEYLAGIQLTPSTDDEKGKIYAECEWYEGWETELPDLYEKHKDDSFNNYFILIPKCDNDYWLHCSLGKGGEGEARWESPTISVSLVASQSGGNDFFDEWRDVTPEKLVEILKDVCTRERTAYGQWRKKAHEERCARCEKTKGEFIALLREVPVQSGTTHPAQSLIKKWPLNIYGDFSTISREIYSEYHESNPRLVADTYTLIARELTPNTTSWWTHTARWLLSKPELDTSIHESAVRICEGAMEELDGEYVAVRVLKDTFSMQTDVLLREYMLQVIEDRRRRDDTGISGDSGLVHATSDSSERIGKAE